VTGSTDHSATENYLTDVGAYITSKSYYGTFDQGGNASEWVETQFKYNGFSFPTQRGGSWGGPIEYVSKPGSRHDVPSMETSILGFRVALIPEPTTATLLPLELLGCVCPRRR
jgi:sulfatase modifying factor 1